MRNFRVHQIDAFTSKAMGGNPTLTVFDGEELSEEELKSLAWEMQPPVTGFVLPSTRGDFRLRFFTRGGQEMQFCGHAAVGALYAIERERAFGVLEAEAYQFQVETGLGLIPMEIDLHPARGNTFKFTAPAVELVESSHTLNQLTEALGIDPTLVDSNYPVMHDKTHNYLLFTATSLDALGQLTLDMRRAVDFSAQHNILLYAALTPHAYNAGYDVHTRAFAPALGIPEDPFTGSLQGALIQYLRTHNLISLDQTQIGSEQGHFMRRPGHVQNHILSTDPLEVQLHAEAVHLFSTEISMV